jgi:putative phosphoribosyl transferase
MFTQKIYTKKNSKCEIAIISETQEVVVHEELLRAFGLNLEKIYKQSSKLYLQDISEYKMKYRQGLDILDLKGKNVLLVDEGLNTGLTMMACIKSVINCNAKSICVAVPVLPKVTVNDIETIADDLYFVHSPAHFVSIDFYYEDLEQIELEDIQRLRNNYKKENNVNHM